MMPTAYRMHAYLRISVDGRTNLTTGYMICVKPYEHWDILHYQLSDAGVVLSKVIKSLGSATKTPKFCTCMHTYGCF